MSEGLNKLFLFFFLLFIHERQKLRMRLAPEGVRFNISAI